MKTPFLMLLIIVPFFCTNSQSKIEDDLDIAFQNAKKGVYWALSNIPVKKTKIENDLIADDKLYSSVRLTKEINGIKIESTGYHLSNEITIKIYKSNDILLKEGFIKYIKEAIVEEKEN